MMCGKMYREMYCVANYFFDCFVPKFIRNGDWCKKESSLSIIKG